jgi:16S rRNA (cytidine1402-2'-O)-methyltransferase
LSGIIGNLSTHTLYIVPTPIGNLEDITLRALRILREVRLIAAEDTRTTHKLLAHYAIGTPQIAYHEHNKLTRLESILEALTQGDVALVSDAGTPGISDPGYELIREAIARGIPVVPLPGPSAVLPALVASGMPTDSYLYLGFLPRKAGELRAALNALTAERRTLIVYESPNRLTDTLVAILEVLGDRPVAVARELTKLYEEFRRGPASEVLAHFTEHEPRGEIVLVIGGALPESAEVWSEARVLAALQTRLTAGETRSAAVKAVAAEAGWERRVVYDLSLSITS